METYDVIIVGGGINGLTLGAYLARAGAKVLITERRWETGGAIMTDEQSGCRFNTHAVYMMMMDVMPPYDDLRLAEYGCTYLRPQPAVAVISRDGRALCFYSDVKKTAASIAKFSQRDAEKFIKVYADFEAMVNQCLVPQTYRPAVPALELFEMLSTKDIGKKILDISEQSPLEIIEGCGFETELLKAGLLYLTTMWGIDPEVTGVGYLVPIYVVRMLDAALIRAGSHRLSSAVLKSYLAAGGTVAETTEIGEVLIEGGRAVGVRATDGREFRAKAVVSTVDPEQTFLRFIGEEPLNRLAPGLADAVKGWEWEAVSHYGLHLILDREPVYEAKSFDAEANEAMIQVLGVENVSDLVAQFRSVQKGGLASLGHVTTITKFDKSQGPRHIDKFMADWEAPPKNLTVVRFETIAPYEPQDGNWEKLKDTYADKVLQFLGSYAPNISQAKIIRRYPYPPTFIEMKFPNMKRGSIKHGEYLSIQMGYFRPNDQCSRYRTPIPGLYVAGASTYPGGMVLLGAGYAAAGILAEDLNLKPWWKLPNHIEEAIKNGFAV